MLPLAWWAVALPVLGAIFGSYVATLVQRWPEDRSTNGRSRCDHCERQLSAVDLVPILSWLVLRGRCRTCGTRIPAEALWIESLYALMPLALLFVFSIPKAIGLAVFFWVSVPLFLLDLRHLWLPNRLVAILAVTGLTLGAWTGMASLFDRVLGGVIGFGLLWAVSWAYRKLRGREGMGAGDPKLFGAICCWTGLIAIPFLLMFASAIGLTFALLRMRGHSNDVEAYPFGSFLVSAAWLYISILPVWFPSL